jgi:hypothetical protein
MATVPVPSAWSGQRGRVGKAACQRALGAAGPTEARRPRPRPFAWQQGQARAFWWPAATTQPALAGDVTSSPGCCWFVRNCPATELRHSCTLNHPHTASGTVSVFSLISSPGPSMSRWPATAARSGASMPRPIRPSRPWLIASAACYVLARAVAAYANCLEGANVRRSARQ